MADHQPKTVLLTGATGFVGRAACPVFANAGLTVVAATRKPAAVAGAKVVHDVGDIGPETDWASALAGVDTVVHLAARVHVTSDNAADPQAEYRRVNVDGTLALAHAAVKAGSRRFVFVSSVKANGDTTPVDRPFRDEDLPQPSDFYGKSKLDGETALEAFARDTGLQLVILRPPLVYGPGVGANFRALLWLCDSPWPLPFARVTNRRSMIFAGNLVDALRQAIVTDSPLPGPWLVSDGDDFSLAELTRHLRRDLGRAERLLPVPPFLMMGAAMALGQRGRADRLLGSLRIDGSGFRKAFGWTPPFTAREGFSATAAWYRGALR